MPTTEVGAYLMRVEVERRQPVLDAATAGVAVAYSPELRFIGTDLPFLRQWPAPAAGWCCPWP